ncbi:MAG: DedA family protein [Candidatus Zixiibacteriota bacterium]
MGDGPITINQLLNAVFSYGALWVYVIIFLACFIENIIPPFPGDSFIVAAGGLVAYGRLDFLPVFLIIIVGGLSSIMILFFLGKYYGRDYFIKKDFKYISANDIIKIEKHFHRWGFVILIFSRFVVGLRSALALAAGISQYRTYKMFFYSIISYILFAGLLMCATIELVENLDLLKLYFKTYHLIFWLILIIIFAFYILNKFFKLRKIKE